MKYFTQSRLAPHGNCWQTAIACILGVEPEGLPPQSEIEAWDNRVLDGWGGYSNCINGYLRTHHNLAYATVYAREFLFVRPIREEVVLCGPSVRTEAHRANGVRNCHHCVVGVNGLPVWDPHPSRAGLIAVTDWGVIGPYAPEVDAEEKARLERIKGNGPYHDWVFGCLCPAHNLHLARERAEQLSAPKPEAAKA